MDPHFVEPKPNLVIDAQPRRSAGARRPRAGDRLAAAAGARLAQREDHARPAGQPRRLDAHPGARRAGDQGRSLDGRHPPAGQSALLDSAGQRGDRRAARSPSGWRRSTRPAARRYEANLDKFQASSGSVGAGWEKRAAALRGTKIVTYHKSWSYVSKWLGLHEVGYVEPKPGIPAPPSHIAQLIGFMRREGVKLILMESFYPRNTVRAGGRQGGRAGGGHAERRRRHRRHQGLLGPRRRRRQQADSVEARRAFSAQPRNSSSSATRLSFHIAKSSCVKR